jgi:hypothetical protein
MLLHDAEELLLRGCDTIGLESVRGRGMVKGNVETDSVALQKQVFVVP